MPTRVRSYSKINLGLAIGPVRADGFHELTTLYQTLAAHDVVTISAEPAAAGQACRIVLTSNDRRVPLDGRNTVWKMLERVLALEPYGSRGWVVQVDIDKRLPVQGGLGAGSANAAAALVGLERETGLMLPGAERLRVAAEVGSDVPLFLIGGAVLGLGRGEQVFPMPDLEGEGRANVEGSSQADLEGSLKREVGGGHKDDIKPSLDEIRDESRDLATDAAAIIVVLALPEVGVSTPQAFRDWDARAAGIDPSAAGAEGLPLTAAASSPRLEELSRALAAALCEPQTSSGVFPANARGGLARHTLPALVRTGIRNDFEEVVFRQHPFLGTIKRALLGLGDESVGEPVPGRISAAVPATGVLYAALSGSGSALFGLYSEAQAAADAEMRVQALGVRTLRTRLLSRAAYWQQMCGPDHAKPESAGTSKQVDQQG